MPGHSFFLQFHAEIFAVLYSGKYKPGLEKKSFKIIILLTILPRYVPSEKLGSKLSPFLMSWLAGVILILGSNQPGYVIQANLCKLPTAPLASSLDNEFLQMSSREFQVGTGWMWFLYAEFSVLPYSWPLI